MEASFLSDDGEAAILDKQRVSNIGINGLQQLNEKDDRFIEVEQNLFSPLSQSLQRYMQRAETNKQLDVVKFLLRLSPYMQLKKAHKAMEWMVHRYNVHLRNVDTLMMCVLPYHDQEPFIMALQLLNMTSNECAKWRWLEPVKKGRTSLPRQTLVTHCRAAKGFLGFICDMLSNHIEANTDDSGTPSARHLQRVISFYTETILAVLTSGPPSESILSTLIPAITAGLKSHDLPDHMMSSYMILMQLFTQTTLAKTLLDSFLNVIAKNAQANLLLSAVRVLVIMFQKQDISKVSKKAFKYLSRHPSLTQILAGLSREFKTEPFLTPFMAVLTQRALKESTGNTMTADEDDSAPLLSLLIGILTKVPLEKQTIAVVSRGVLTWFSENREGTTMETDDPRSQSDGAFRVFRLLDNRFSSILNTVANELISHDESRMATIVTLLITSEVLTLQDFRSDPHSIVAVCLHHQNANARKSAVEKLLQNPNLMDNISSVQAAIALILEDDDASVVSAVLNKPQGLWELFEDKSLLLHTLLKKLRACGGKKGRNDTRSQVLKTLCYVPDVASTMEVTACVLSFLVALDESEIDLVESLLQSPVIFGHVETGRCRFFRTKSLQQPLNSKTKEIKLGGLCLKLVKSVTSHLMSNSQETQVMIENLHNSMAATPRPGSLALLLLLVTESLIKRVRKLEVKMGLQRQLLVLLSDFVLRKHLIQPSKIVIEPETGKSSSSKKELNVDTSLSQLAVEGTLPVGLIADLLTRVKFVPLPSKLKDLKFWELSEKDGLEGDWLRTVTLGVNLLVDMAVRTGSRMSAVERELLILCSSVLTDTKYMVRLLCMLWMANEKQGVSSTHKAYMHTFAIGLFNSLPDAEKTKLAEDPTPILPCLLILLSSQYEQVRKEAFTLLTSLAGDTSSDSSNFKWFAGNLLRYKQEVTTDNAFLAQVLKNILEGEESNASPPSPKKRKRTSSKPLPYSVTLTYLLDVICDQQTSSKVKAGLLAVLHKLDTSDSFLPLMPLLKDLISKPVTHQPPPTSPSSPPPPSIVLSVLTVEEREMVALLLKRFTTTVAACIQESNASLQALLAALSCPWAIKDSGDTVQMAALEQLSSKFMSALPYQSRQAVFTCVLDVMSADSSVELTKHCRKVIKHMTVESSLIVDEFKSVLAKSSAGTIREAKRQKLQQTGQSEESELDSLPWKRVTMLLKMVQSKKKVSSPVLLIPVALQMLGKVLELENKGSGEYIKQEILTMIIDICSRNKDGGDADIVGEHLNIELIVQCICSSDNQQTQQQALLLLSSAAKIAPSCCHQVLRQCVKVLSSHHDNGMVSASAMLCLAEIVSTAKVHTIEYLGEFVPLLISQLQSETITHDEVLLLAAVTLLQKVIESLPLFLSPYLLDLIVQVCIISSVVESQSHKPAVGQKIKLICSTLATVTPTRTFLPVLEKSFLALEDKMASCAECAMSMLKDHVVKMSREDLTTFSHDLLKFFFVCFDIRATHEEISESDLDVIEGRVIEAFVSLVFKLSEAQFKPMLLQLYTWATDEEASRERVLVFYRLCDSLAEKQKNLFAGHILKHSTEMLDTNNKNKNKCRYFGKGKMACRKSCRLLCYIVDCLQKTFAHDTEGFLNKERFDVVMQPLVDQLENELGKDSISEDRVTKHIVPCIASLAAAAHDDSLWKDLNYQILLKTKHQSPKVRIWALAAVDAFHKQLGEDYTQLIPETMPILGHLLRDESDEVQKYTQKVVANIEVSARPYNMKLLHDMEEWVIT